MIDDLREQASEMEIEEEEMPAEQVQPPPDLVLGMTPVQRFIIAVMLLFAICLMSTFCLLVTGKITLPFFY